MPWVGAGVPWNNGTFTQLPGNEKKQPRCIVELDNFGLFKNTERFDFFSPNLETKTLALLCPKVNKNKAVP